MDETTRTDEGSREVTSTVTTTASASSAEVVTTAAVEVQAPELSEGEATLGSFAAVNVLWDNVSLGVGALLLTSKQAYWYTLGATRNFDYHNISLYAISRDPTTGYQPCIYAHVDDPDYSDGYHETRFIPSDPTLLERMFQAFSDGSSMNPDPPDDSDDEGNAFFNVDEVMEGARLDTMASHFETMVVTEETPADEAEEEEEEEIDDADTNDTEEHTHGRSSSS
ncbi:hypothetical protein Pelo_7722 [Pelomyxa schiedti]|nr:hypothetical protein Pelo_7722 [Pelomyxa schiedti]